MSADFPAGWPSVALCMAGPPGFVHHQVIAEVVEAMQAALEELGAQVRLTEGEPAAGAFNIVLLPNLLDPELAARLPADAVLYNFEQIASARDNNPVFHVARRRHVLWDYSAANLARLAPEAGRDRLVHVPVGHMPALERIAPAREQDIDLLFFGAFTARRKAILKELHQAGVRLRAVFGVYGAQRDALIARARLVLNIHAESPAILEEVRLAYLMGNAVPVISEFGSDTKGDTALLAGLRAVPRAELASAAFALLGDPAALQALGAMGREVIRKRPETEILKRALRATAALLRDG